MKLDLNLNPKTFFMMAGAVFLAGSGVTYLTYSNVGEQRKAVASLKTQLRDTKEVQKDIDAGKKKIAELKGKLSHLENGVPSAAYVATMLGELETYGNQMEVKITSVKPVVIESRKKDNEKSKSAYEEQNIQVKGRGTFDGAVKFVNALKRFPKIVAVRTLSITPKDVSKVEKGSPVLEFEIYLQAYVFKEDMESSSKAESPKTATKGDLRHES